MQFVDLKTLSPLQRIILISDGTLTELLEHLIDEPLQVVKLHESIEATDDEIAYLDLPKNQQVITREICLQGKKSGQNWLYAKSKIVLDRLPPLFREDLLASQIPIGKLWAKHRVETYKEIEPPFFETAEKLAIHFNIAPEKELLGRTYRVFSNQQPMMMLTEKFPASFFKELR
ncbi:MAG: chorismate lyase [Methylococcales bacterium]|nr:chorismate lyase [Methylococcales bacterium]